MSFQKSVFFIKLCARLARSFLIFGILIADFGLILGFDNQFL
jgi:hypothetical protein